MAYELFTPPGEVSVSPGSSVSFEPRVNRADFGDGYSQRSGDGLNGNPAAFEAVFTVLFESEVNAITGFFAAKKGYTPFLWTMPGESTPRQWIATKWRVTYTGKMTRDVIASFEENFDPRPSRLQLKSLLQATG